MKILIKLRLSSGLWAVKFRVVGSRTAALTGLKTEKNWPVQSWRRRIRRYRSEKEMEETADVVEDGWKLTQNGIW